MYVCAAHKSLNLSGFNRLYAYPAIPDLSGEEMVILDSGAFALSKSKKQMDAEYIDTLAQHYRQFLGRENVYAIAPDVFKNRIKSMRQYELFTEQYRDIPICPVIQFSNSTIDLFNAKKQIDHYAAIKKSRLVCLSNNRFNPVSQSQSLRFIVDYIRKHFGNVWVHVLGAGYSYNNVQDWMKTGVNSVDSISYYTDAQHNLRWLPYSYGHESSNIPFSKLALINAQVANI